MPDPMSILITIEHLEEILMPAMAGTAKQLERDLTAAQQRIAALEGALSDTRESLLTAADIKGCKQSHCEGNYCTAIANGMGHIEAALLGDGREEEVSDETAGI